MNQPRQCPWCAAPVGGEATTCPACGAAVAQLESIGGLKIAGLTAVDPALEDFDKRPLHLGGPSPTHGVAPALFIGAVAGGPIGLVAIGGVAAVAGAELMGTRHGEPGGPALEDVGRPSEVLLQALRKAEGASGAPAAPGAEASAGPLPADADPADSDPADADDGRSIWRDLPTEPEASSG